MSLESATITLFLVFDPLGNLPLFLLALRHVAPERQRRVILRELLIALGVLMLFLFLGNELMDLLGVSRSALGVAGGLILMLIALRMVFPQKDDAIESHEGEPFIFPLAIPYIAGPSSMATVVLLQSAEPERWATWVAATLLAWLACVPIFLYCYKLRDWLGERGLKAMERLMGLVLVTIAVDMLMKGAAQYLRAV